MNQDFSEKKKQYLSEKKFVPTVSPEENSRTSRETNHKNTSHMKTTKTPEQQ